MQNPAKMVASQNMNAKMCANLKYSAKPGEKCIINLINYKKCFSSKGMYNLIYTMVWVSI